MARNRAIVSTGADGALCCWRLVRCAAATRYGNSGASKQGAGAARYARFRAPEAAADARSSGDDAAQQQLPQRYAALAAKAPLAHKGGAYQATFSPGEEDLVLSGGADQALRLWDAATLAPLCHISLSAPLSCGVYGLTGAREYH